MYEEKGYVTLLKHYKSYVAQAGFWSKTSNTIRGFIMW